MLGVGCRWVVGVGVYALSASPCSNSEKRNHIVKCSRGVGVVGGVGVGCVLHLHLPLHVRTHCL